MLDFEGAAQRVHLRTFLEEMNWWNWKLLPGFILQGEGEGELQKLAVQAEKRLLIYFPDNSSCLLATEGKIKKISWYNTKTGESHKGTTENTNEFTLLPGWDDGILILEME